MSTAAQHSQMQLPTIKHSWPQLIQDLHRAEGLLSSLMSAVSYLSSPRQPLFMADFDTSETDYFVTWARNSVHRAHSSYGRMYDRDPA